MSEGHFGRSARAPLTLSGAQGLEAGLVAQGELAGLHHQREAAEEDRKRVGLAKSAQNDELDPQQETDAL